MARKKIESEPVEEIEREKPKEDFLQSLMEASIKKKGFSVKDVKRKTTDKPSKFASSDLDLGATSIPDRIEPIISEDEWDELTDYFEELSPIDDITYEERYGYRKNRGEDEYQALFKKEKSMLSDVLSSIQKRSKIVESKINAMNGKGAYGVSKNFVDLVDASATLDQARINIIKEMVNINKTAVDLRLKDKRLTPDDGMDDNDSVASAFYKQLMGGNNVSFMQNTLNPMSSYQVAQQMQDIPGLENEDLSEEEYDSVAFNISQPINNQIPDEVVKDMEVDKYGYIANENKNVSIVVYRYDNDNDRLQFVALDEEGVEVDDYMLPDKDLLLDMNIRPMSNYAYDKYQRKYRIMDVGSTVEYDIDDSSYDNYPDDNKYNR